MQLVTLLLHQRRLDDALAQYDAHHALFRAPPLRLPPAQVCAYQLPGALGV